MYTMLKEKGIQAKLVAELGELNLQFGTTAVLISDSSVRHLLMDISHKITDILELYRTSKELPRDVWYYDEEHNFRLK